MTTDEQVKKIRLDLKKEGYTSRMVSVRQRHCGYSSAIDITIKSFDVDIKKVKELSECYESYERDPSGDILLGGNTYVSVDFDYDLRTKASENFMNLATEIYKISADVDCGINIAKHGDFLLYYFPSPRYGTAILSVNNNGKDSAKYNSRTRFEARNKHEIANSLVNIILIDKLFKEKDFCLKK